jgi:transcriptional regulator NrdR family protein
VKGPGLAILGPLRDLDEVDNLRFASVYRSFLSIGDFEKTWKPGELSHHYMHLPSWM